jgi:hypothetical protein
VHFGGDAASLEVAGGDDAFEQVLPLGLQLLEAV